MRAVDRRQRFVVRYGVVGRSRWLTHLLEVVTIAFVALYVLLFARFLLEFAGASPDNVVSRLSEPFYAPFDGVLRDSIDSAGRTIDWSVFVALAVYVVLHSAVHGVVRWLAPSVAERIDDEDGDGNGVGDADEDAE